jgi:lysophospholipase L1-like esterase
MKKIIVWLLLAHSSFAQNNSYQWFDPSTKPVIDGRGWHQELASPYDRFPAKAEKTIRPAVWNLSRHTAGEYIQFTTNSNSLVVKYAVKGAQSMPHMPATGVSGLDLYALTKNGQWNWAKGSWKFGDTIEYRYNNLELSLEGETFRLYLPLYTAVQWMLIGVPEGSTFSAMPVSEEKPIVAYGTSILHGGCASRPGLAWTNILGRKLNKRIINLGFSGNGQLEQPVIDLLNELDASLFILDCMPNLSDRNAFSAEEVESRIRKSVKDIQSRHPGTPIVLAEHCSGIDGMNMDSTMTARYKAVSILSAAVFDKMKKEGVQNIYSLTAKEINFDTESTVDGTHPNDIGMMKYAEAYYKVIAPLLGKAGLNEKY